MEILNQTNTKLEKNNILGININNITKEEFLNEIDRLIKRKKHSYVVTPYSEFFLFAREDEEFKKAINNADISIADGIGVPLAKKYKKMKGVYFSIAKCLFSLIFNKKFFSGEIKEKLSGSEAIYYISEFAAKKGFKIFFLGGFDFGNGDTGKLAAKKLKEMYPELKIAGTYMGSSSKEEEESIIKTINKTDTNILYIAYGPRSQEKWIFKNKNKLKPCVSLCLGGSFDFVSGEKKRVPKFFVDKGLEGILRPIFSERGNPRLIYKRINRGWIGIIKYISLLIKEKKNGNL